MPKKIIHVNQHKIRANVKNGTKNPVIAVRSGKTTSYTNSVEIILGDKVVARFVYRPERPLSCGARLWCEVPSDVNVRLVDDTPEESVCSIGDEHG